MCLDMIADLDSLDRNQAMIGEDAGSGREAVHLSPIAASASLADLTQRANYGIMFDMAKRPSSPHPGEFLRAEIERSGLSEYRVALDLGVPLSNVKQILNGQRGISATVALRLGRYFGPDAEFWFGAQAKYELDSAREEHGKEIERAVKPRKDSPS
jgi:addiction module HigA family antidote